jgi:hypothetical protein
MASMLRLPRRSKRPRAVFPIKPKGEAASPLTGATRASVEWLGAFIDREIYYDNWAKHVFIIPLAISWVIIYFIFVVNHLSPTGSWQVSNAMLMKVSVRLIQ